MNRRRVKALTYQPKSKTQSVSHVRWLFKFKSSPRPKNATIKANIVRSSIRANQSRRRQRSSSEPISWRGRFSQAPISFFRLFSWNQRRFQRVASTVVYATLLLSIIIFGVTPTQTVYAGTTPYDFSVPGDYSVSDATQIEVTSNQARLKSQQYTGAEANTSALYHFDETTGNTAADSSANSNDVTIGTTSPSAGGDWEAGKVTDPAIDRTAYGSALFNNASSFTTASAADSASLSLTSNMTIEAYIKFPSAFDKTANMSQAILDKGNYKLYFDESDGKLKYELDDNGTKEWTKKGGADGTTGTDVQTKDGISGSWQQVTPMGVYSMAIYNSALYVGTGGALGGMAEVWRYDSATCATCWTKVGGDAIGGSWDALNYEMVMSMAVFSNRLYVGLGYTAGDAEVYQYDPSRGTPWDKIGGDGTSNSWTTANGIEGVYSMVADASFLYVGTGLSAGDADVWRFNGTNWGSNIGANYYLNAIGGTYNNGTTNINSSWGASGNVFDRVWSMVFVGTTLYIGLGDTAGEAEVWGCASCSTAAPVTWGGARIGGRTTNGSWADTTYEWVASMATDGTNLYAGLGGTGTLNANQATCRAGTDGEVWKYWDHDANGGTPFQWTKIGGDSVDSWDCNASVAYETVRGLAYVGTSIYASLGDSAGDGEVYRYSGADAAWTRVGGDGVNTSWDAAWTAGGAGTTNSKDQVFLGANGTNLVALTMSATNGRAEVWSCASCGTSPTWSWIGGRDFKSWGSMQLAQVQDYAMNDGKLYVGLGSNAAATPKQAVVYEYDGTTWTQIGGGNLNLASGGWEYYENIRSMVSYKGEVYVGMGDTAQDADVWKWNGSTWTQIGGDGLNNGWTAANNIEEVSAMAADNTYLYAGVGNSASDADIWRWDGTNWGSNTGASYYLNAIGGTRNDNNSNLNSSWGAVTVFDRINRIAIYNGLVYVALGSTGTLNATPATCRANTDSEIWRWNGSTWTRIAGDGVNSSWDCSATIAAESVRSLAFVGTTLYAGLGDTNDAVNSGDADVWSCSNCTDVSATPVWTQIGGDDATGVSLNSSWDAKVYEQVLSLAGYNGELYAGLGNTAGDAEIWKWDGVAWSQVGGDSVGSSFSVNYENVQTLGMYQGRLLAGLGASIGGNSQSDAEVWSLGGTEHIISSTTASWSANVWTHVAATYDGSSAKIYVNGVQDGDTVSFTKTLADGSLPLTIGGLKSPKTHNIPAVGFSGFIDELRISNTARAPNTFVLTQYAASAATVQPVAALTRNQKQNWNGFDATEVTNGGTVTYRVSSNGGTNWKYWDSGGSAWAESTLTTQANTKAVINTNLPTLDAAPLDSGGLMWQAILTGNGDQQVILDDASVSYVGDTQAPNNVSSVSGNDGNWYNRSAPSFSWTAPSDKADTGGGEVASGVEGYYVYFGSNGAADPAVLGAFQTGTTYTPSAVPDGQTYYLRIKTRDNAQNTTTDVFDYFRDTGAPNDVATVTGNGNSGSWFLRANPIISWTEPTDPVGGAGEISSGIKGYYVYFGTSNTADPTVTSGTLNPGGAVKFVTSPTVTAPPLDTADTNVYYFRIRAMDKAMNLSPSVFSAFIDTTSPNPITSVTGNNGTWFNRANPQFSWSAPSDVAGSGEKASGIFGYYVYFGTNGSATPKNDGTFVSATTYSGTPISNSDKYYFKIQAADRNFNVSTVYDAFRDTIVPPNVTTVTGNNGNWFDRTNPQFSWTAPVDTADVGEQVSGINGYFVYFGTNASAVPRTDGTLVTGTTYAGTPISSSDVQPYYFLIQTRDNAMNVTSDISGILNQFNDSTRPNNITSVTGNSGNWYDRSNPVFSWSAATDQAAGPGEVQSGVYGYFVYFGKNASAVPSLVGTFQTGTTYTATPISSSDTDIYYLRIQTRDNAMNVSTGIYDQFRDTKAPNNITTVTSLSGVGGTPITTATWYNHSAPQFSWSAPTDDLPAPNTNTEVAAGVSGYYVYFGPNSGATPSTNGSFQTGTTYVPGTMTSGLTYYLRIQTRDKALNTSTIFGAFTYQFDNVGPSGPTTSASPAGYSAVNSFTFFWIGTGAGAAVDPSPGAGLPDPKQYKYRVGSSDWSVVTTESQITLDGGDSDPKTGPAYQEGANVFEIKALDAIGNEGSTTTVTFYYSGNAPTPPENLTVSPTTTEGAPSTSNAFAFSWDPPSSSSSPIKQYRFTVNKTPTAQNSTVTPYRTLAAAPYATQQGKNTFYVVAVDEADNVNYDNPAQVNFYTLTPAPSAPTNPQIFDISNRDTAEYAISMKWTEPTKASGFDGYEVYRSEDNVTFTSAGTTKSPVFIDTNLLSKIYYYKIKSKDNAGQVSIDSTTVNITPTGRFTTPPKLLNGPETATKSFSAIVEWTTDRIGSSFIEYGLDPYHLGKQNGGDTVGTLDLTTAHTVAIKGLEPETIYSYQAVWVDQDGNRGQSEILSFKTGLRPKISDVTITNITLTSATINWVSTTVSTSTINYGLSKSFGQVLSDTSGGGTTKHSMQLTDLKDTSTYYFVITGKDLDDNSLSSDDYSFTTLTRPIISEFKYETVKDAPTTAIKFTWTTNVPTTSIVTVTKVGAAPKSQADSEYTTSHELTVKDLSDLTPYSLQGKGVDRYGNNALSETASFTTPDDSRPPKVLNMTVEVRSSGVGATQKAQLIINWETDEPGSSQVEYGPGISSDNYPSKTQEDAALGTTHVVIVPELEPAKLYHFRAVSRDRANNAGTSDDTTSITGKVQRSVVDIIMASLQRSLGFLSAIPGLGSK